MCALYPCRLRSRMGSHVTYFFTRTFPAPTQYFRRLGHRAALLGRKSARRAIVTARIAPHERAR